MKFWVFKMSELFTESRISVCEITKSNKLNNERYSRVRNLKFATYLNFATSGNTNKINELR